MVVLVSHFLYSATHHERPTLPCLRDALFVSFLHFGYDVQGCTSAFPPYILLDDEKERSAQQRRIV